MKPIPPNAHILRNSFHVAVRGWKGLNNVWKRERLKCSCFYIILDLLTVSMHQCPFSLSYLIMALLALLLCAYAAPPACLSACGVSLIDADQVLYSCAYLYWTLHWAKGIGWKLFSSSRKLLLSLCRTHTNTHIQNERDSQITSTPSELACIASPLRVVCNWK